MTKRTKSILILLSIILFVTGLFTYFKFILSFIIKGEGISYQSYGITDQGKGMIIFSLVLAAIPLSPLLLRLTKTKSILVSSGILLGCVIAAILIKRFLLMKDISEYNVVLVDKSIETHLSLAKSTPEYYMLAAFLVGILTPAILKREKILFKKE